MWKKLVIHLTVVMALVVLPGVARSATVTVYNDWGAYQAAAGPQTGLTFPFANGTLLSNQQPLLDQGISFTSGQTFPQYGGYYGNTALPERAANTEIGTVTYDPTHLHFTDGTFSFFVVKAAGAGTSRFAVFDAGNNQLASTISSGSSGVGFVSDTRIWSAFLGPQTANAKVWGDLSYGSAPVVPEPGGLGLIGIALLALRRRRG